MPGFTPPQATVNELDNLRPALTVPVRAARRLAVLRQGLAGPSPRRRPGAEDVLRTCESLGCLQLDPTSAVARSHLLVLFSRLGPFDPALLERLVYEDRRLFEYWAHDASLVLSADLPLHAWLMARWPRGGSVWAREGRAWLEANAGFREHLLERLAADGPLRARDIEDRASVPWGIRHPWTDRERQVARLLDLLWGRGEVLVSRREGNQRLWDLPERCLPPGTVSEPLPDAELTRLATQRSLRALGVATARHIRSHFTRDRYPGLEETLVGLAREGAIAPVTVHGDDGESLAGTWWVHADDAPVLAALARDEHPWRPRTVLLSPFDNLICDRTRLELLFGFSHRLEIYVPRAKRRWGYFVMPVLHGERLIGRVDVAVDRPARRLDVHAVHRERGAPRGVGVARSLRRELERLARWRGVEHVRVATAPAEWARGLEAAA